MHHNAPQLRQPKAHHYAEPLLWLLGDVGVFSSPLFSFDEHAAPAAAAAASLFFCVARCRLSRISSVSMTTIGVAPSMSFCLWSDVQIEIDNQQVTKYNYVHARLPLVELLRHIACKWESLWVRTIELSYGGARSLLERWKLDENFSRKLLYRLPCVVDELLIAALLIRHKAYDKLVLDFGRCKVNLGGCIHSCEKLLIDSVGLPGDWWNN